MEPGNPFQALTYFSHFFEKPWKEMFEGALVSVPDMPWSYLRRCSRYNFPNTARLLAAGVVALSSRCRIRTSRHVQNHPADADARGDAAAGHRDVKRPALYNGIRHFIS